MTSARFVPRRLFARAVPTIVAGLPRHITFGFAGGAAPDPSAAPAAASASTAMISDPRRITRAIVPLMTAT